jgi:anti-anti-sigma regulatory factor
MATKDERPGLLSKMAKFVRNPTKDWSELDQPEESTDSAYDKQALKAMIERKRQNDFVRKREFDQLRKLRNRDPGAVAAMARPSFFQSSIPTDQDGRAVTLKKIDEIEAQMSKQWWKGKQDGQTGSDKPGEEIAVASTDVRGSSPTGQATLVTNVQTDQYAPTAYASIGNSSQPGSSGAMEFAPTEMGSGMVPMAEIQAGREGGSGKVIEIQEGLAVEEMTTDPELEEAAIRFANGDDAGAEASLLQALRGNPSSAEAALSWAGALLDLYRATGKHAEFSAAVDEFGALFTQRAPVWSVIGSRGDTTPTPIASPAPTALGPNLALWICPSTLSMGAMEELRDVMAQHPTPWHLDWTPVAQILPQAMPLLAGLFASLCEEPVQLRFSGADSLVKTLRLLTPSGNRAVDTDWWKVRMDVMRALQMQDEFELTALDYCVTFEVSPPPWEEAKCTYEKVRTDGVALADEAQNQVAGSMQLATAPMALETQAVTLELKGEILGDAMEALVKLEGNRQIGGNLTVSCRALTRADFSAAGSILNWAATRESEGSQIVFRDVHRLVAAFFNVIGINEHARIAPRAL